MLLLHSDHRFRVDEQVRRLERMQVGDLLRIQFRKLLAVRVVPEG